MNRRELLQKAGIILGATVSLPVSRAVLAGVQAPAISPSAGGLSVGSLGTISAVSARIIPATDTPGAIEAKVPEFVDLIYRDWYTPLEQTQFITAERAFLALSKEKYKQDFEECSSEQQDEFLGLCESRVKEETAPEGFYFKTMKELTVLGYYTSEIGAKQELSYNPVPMRYKGDYLFSDVGKQWSY
ncbi:MAG: gluconate 2-dehydrogenase subunit 3 family protein [Halioglobus sp.]